MDGQATLSQVTDAVVYAAREAQNAVEKQHQGFRDVYYDSEGNPRMVELRLPDGRPIRVPEISLVPASSFKIALVDVEFTASITEMSKGEDVNDIQVSFAPPTSGSCQVKVKISLTAADPPEGLVRINDAIVRALP